MQPRSNKICDIEGQATSAKYSPNTSGVYVEIHGKNKNAETVKTLNENETQPVKKVKQAKKKDIKRMKAKFKTNKLSTIEEVPEE